MAKKIPIAREAAAKAGFWTKKRLGQHLLRDPSVASLAIQSLKAQDADLILEIGPGLGALTEGLLLLGVPVLGVEVDAQACAALASRFEGLGQFELLHADILELDLKAEMVKRGVKRVCIAANLPYYITTPVLAKLLEEEVPFTRMAALTQWEVAARLAAPPGGKDRAAISVLMQFWCRVEILRKVSPGAFTPPPKVDSALLLLERLPRPSVEVADRALFFKAVRASFGKRRKTLRNALKMSGEPVFESADLEAAFAAAKVDPVRRAETLSLEEWARLANAFI